MQSTALWPARAAYADPPYPGYARYYPEHQEVDHAALITQLEQEFDGWALHTFSNALRDILPLCPERARVAAWVKGWFSYKPGVSPAYGWEPVIFVPVRKAREFPKPRDWFQHNAATGRGLVGAKPEAVAAWVFDLLGLTPNDELVDLFPGTGAITRSWETWRAAA